MKFATEYGDFEQALMIQNTTFQTNLFLIKNLSNRHFMLKYRH
jgi:hypothetical protein